METCAILAINSLDRYSVATGNNQSQLYGIPLILQYNNDGQPCNDFKIISGGALIYGYIKKIQISQTQLFYNIPTVNARNYLIIIESPSLPVVNYAIEIPFGFWTPNELAGQIELLIRQINAAPFDENFTVTYDANNGFVFKTNTVDTFNFLNATAPANANLPASFINTLLKAYRLIGMDIQNSVPATIQISTYTPIFLYTSYIDIISETLTKYQKVKDTDSSPQKQGSIVSRIYLAGTGSPQIAAENNVDALGSRPFTVVQDMNYCKTVQWSKDEAVNSLDFQLKDQYGDLIYFGEQGQRNIYNTEFQMTLLCIEEQN